MGRWNSKVVELGEVERVLAGGGEPEGSAGELRTLKGVLALGEGGDDAVAKSIEAVEVATSTLREKAGTLAARSADLANLLDAALEADACAFPSPRRKPGPSANAPSATATSLRQRTGPNRTLPQGSLTCVSSSFILGSPPDEPAHTPEVRDREASQAARLLAPRAGFALGRSPTECALVTTWHLKYLLSTF